VAEHKPRVLLLDLSRVFDIEYSALQMMMEGERRYADEGITVWLAVLNPDVLRYIRSSELADRLGDARLFPNVRAAIRRYRDGPLPSAGGAGAEVAVSAPSGPSH
jgi:sulfate permease, SulP family